MGKFALLAAALLLLTSSKSALTQEKKPSTDIPTVNLDLSNRITGFTAWDDEFLYLAVHVNKPNLIGKNTEPFSHPLEDDAVIISLQSDNNHQSTKRTASTFTLAVSAFGGLQFYSGSGSAPLFESYKAFNAQFKDILDNVKDPDQQKKQINDLQGRLIKIQVIKQDTADPAASKSPGYTFEVAIPWKDLEIKPLAGTKLGVNISAQSKAPGSPPLQSLSVGVKTSSDFDNPSLWIEMVLSNAPAPSSPTTLISPRVFTAKPVIDGELTSGEWNGLSLFSFGETPLNVVATISQESIQKSRQMPEFVPRPARPIVALPVISSDPLPVTPHRKQKVSPLVFARYEYWYQADTRKAAPVQHVTRPDNGSLLAHHPLDGTGPWFSYDRAEWHRKQLNDMRQAGIDVVLPDYRGSAVDRQLYADKGLSVMVTGLQSLRTAGLDYPQIALYLNTESLIKQFGEHPSLKDSAVQSGMFGVVRDFYRHIPAEFRCVVPLSSENGGRPAYFVFLSDAAIFSDLDSTFVTYLRGRFINEFGADLVIVGANNFQAKSVLDGYFARPTDKPATQGGWVSISTVRPGFDRVSLEGTPNEKNLPLRSQDSYRASWTAALAAKPDLILIDSWNDYTTGSEIAPTLEEGFSNADLTRAYSHFFITQKKTGAKFLGHDIPKQMITGSSYSLHLRVQNSGEAGWGLGQSPVAWLYRWKKGGKLVYSSPPFTLTSEILSGQNATLNIPVDTSEGKKSPLTDGDYMLEVALLPTGKKQSANSEIASIELPVSVLGQNAIEAPKWSATLLQSSLPIMLESGSAYEIEATVRNDGSAVWRKSSGARVTLRLYRTVPSGSIDSALTELAVSAADATALLTDDVRPGSEAHIHLLLLMTDPGGKPLLTWNQDQLWTYTARWEIAIDRPAEGVRTVSDANAGFATEGTVFGLQPLAVVDYDFGARFVRDETPASLPANRKQPIQIGIQNVGPQTWKRGQARIGYHWYYLDGTELRWEDNSIAIPEDVPPGGAIKDLLVEVTPPATDGKYYLVWDMKFGDAWASTSAATRVFDIKVHPIHVVGNRLVFAELSKAFNMDGISSEDSHTGDFDGRGTAFPAEMMPPWTDAHIVPAAMWLPNNIAGPESPRRISFRWGPKDGKSLNFISCRGQRIELGKSSGDCRILHIVAATSGDDSLENLNLFFQEPLSVSEDRYSFRVSRWDRPPVRGDEIALLCRSHYEKGEMKPGSVVLFHYTIKIHEPRKLIAITLPNSPNVKIAAISLEQ